MVSLELNTKHSAAIQLIVYALITVATITDSADATTFHACIPRKTMVSTHPTGRYVPYYHELHRCSGGTQNPGTHRCWPVDEEEVKLHLHNVDQERELVTLRNHTRCREVCVCGPCKNNHAISLNEICKPTERWDESSCHCVSSCIRLGNVGRGPDKGNEGYISLGVFIVAMVTESAVLVGLIMIVRHCISRHRSKGKSNFSDIIKCEAQEKCLLTSGSRGAHQERHFSDNDKVSEPTAV